MLRFLQVTTDFAWVNPHLTLAVEWDRPDPEDEDDSPINLNIDATDPNWSKWRPADPTSPHWYDAERLGRLLGANIAHAEDTGQPCPTVLAFIREFRGLSSTTRSKAICDDIGASRQSLAEFYSGKTETVGLLLAKMREASRPIKPRDLGPIGRAHLAEKLSWRGMAPESFDYRRKEFEHEGLPYIVEAAFGYCPNAAGYFHAVTGVNWSAPIASDPFRSLGRQNLSLGSILAYQHVERDHPVVFVLHITCPRISYLDRGKSSIALPSDVGDIVVNLVLGVTDKWARQMKAEIRDKNASARREDRMIRHDRPVTVKSAAYAGMEAAYLKASDDGTLPANARQIYYAARAAILESTSNKSLDAQYFCQTLLVDYIKEYGLDWDVVWDDRGHFTEPHTGETIGLGTLGVRQYLKGNGSPQHHDAGFSPASVYTSGPDGRFGAVLFIEKEGFMPLFEAVKLAERYDIAIMSSKGMSVTAARHLIDEMCSKYDIPLLTLHDFDIAGFSIGKTVGSSNRRYTFQNEVDVVNLGLRLADVNAFDPPLASESFQIVDTRAKTESTLRRNDAEDDEVAFLMSGRRVELNAMTSRQFVEFVERKLEEHGIEKVVPAKETLDAAYRAFARNEIVKEAVMAAIELIGASAADVPADLEQQVREYLDLNPEDPWETAVKAIAAANTN